MEEERKKAKQLCHLLELSIHLMSDIHIEELKEHTLVMIFNATVNHPDFTRAFSGKVKKILENKHSL